MVPSDLKEQGLAVVGTGCFEVHVYGFSACIIEAPVYYMCKIIINNCYDIFRYSVYCTRLKKYLQKSI